MKNKNIFIILILIFLCHNFLYSQIKKDSTNISDRQAQQVHIMINNEALSFLTYKGGYLYQDLVDNFAPVNNGAFDEDEWDMAYGYSGWEVTQTHFWKVDDGDESTVYHGKPNAYTKARRYIHGEFNISVGNPPINGHIFSYCDDNQTGDAGLFSLYKTGKVYCYIHQTTEYLSVPDRKYLSYYILGRICHLLEDMGVPAHIHEDSHWPSDCYEDWCLTSSYGYNEIGTFINPFYDEGTLVSDPIRYLFFVTAQLSDYFASNTRDLLNNCNDWEFRGNNLIPVGNNYNLLNTYYNNILPPFNEFSHDWGVQDVHLRRYSPRAVAALLYWFAQKAGLQETLFPGITGFTQTPYILHPGSSCNVKVNLTNESYPNRTVFWVLNPPYPSGVTLTNHTSMTCHINWVASPKTGREENHYPILLTCNVNFQMPNPIGLVHNAQNWGVVLDYNNGGCPWVFVYSDDSTYKSDNNLFHKSKISEFSGQDIGDRYLLREHPLTVDKMVKLKLYEQNSDTTVFNSIKLFSVDHPAGTKIGITDDNQIVMFDSSYVLSSDKAFMIDSNSVSVDVTEDIQYHKNPKISVMGDTLFHSSTSFPSNSFTNNAYIIKMENDWNGHPTPIGKTAYSGNITALTENNLDYSVNFVRREKLSDIVLPLNFNAEMPGSVTGVNANWNKGFHVRYMALTDVSYSGGFTVKELPIIEAVHSDSGYVTNKVRSYDNEYILLKPSGMIDLLFLNSDSITPGQIRDFVIEVNGRIGTYSNPNIDARKMNPILKNNIQPLLYDNYPNPFNAVTKLRFNIKNAGNVKLKIYDITGREVKVLVNEYKTPGLYSIDFNASDLASGVYFYRLESNNFTNVKKMVLIK